MANVIKFDAEARAAMMRGVNILADTVKVDSEELIVMREDDIMAVVQK